MAAGRARKPPLLCRGARLLTGAALQFSIYGLGYLSLATTATISSGTATCTTGVVNVLTSTAETSNRSQIYAGLQGKSFPAPAFGAQLMAVTGIACGYGNIIVGTACKFSVSQAEAQVDLLAQNPPNGLGVSVIQINLDPYYFVDNSTGSGTARGIFQSVMQYIYSNYGPGSGHSPVVHVRLEPSYSSNNLNTVCHTLVGTPNPLPAPGYLANCVTITPSSASWLQFGGTTYSVYAYLAKYYGPGGTVPVMLDFTDLHEPATTNNNPAYNANFGTTGSAANWASAYNTMATAVLGANALVNNGVAYSRYEISYATTMRATPLSPIVFVGGDEYTTGINDNPTCPSATPCGDMYNLAAILSLASGKGLRVLFTESWLPSWGPSGQVVGDTNAYEGAGNCDWQTFDLVRQTLSATTMWASANGLSEVNFFSAADAATACVYGGFNNGNDRITPPSTYLATVAGATISSTALRTKTFYWLQQLINNWAAVVASGQPLPF